VNIVKLPEQLRGPLQDVGRSFQLGVGAANGAKEDCLLLNQATRSRTEEAKSSEVFADYNFADHPIWCPLRATGSLAGSCANPNIGVVTLGPSPRRFPPPWSVEELDACGEYCEVARVVA
jgi:hypothetical protein